YAESRNNEKKPDTMSSPPSISSTKGAQMKKRASAIKSCTVEKRRNLKRASTGFIDSFDFKVSMIQSSRFRDGTGRLGDGQHNVGAVRRQLPTRCRGETSVRVVHSLREAIF